MRTRLIVLLCVGAVLACSSHSKQQQDVATSRSDKLLRVRNALPGRYVVVLRDSIAAGDLAGTADDLARRYKGTVLQVYGAALHGFALEIPSSSAPTLAEEPVVRYVEEDGRMRIAGLVSQGAALHLATGAATGPTGAGATVYVLDTGVRADHVELVGRASAAWPDAKVAPQAGDCNGHGTWVAALAAGSTVGVAPGASVRAVTVLGCDGEGAVSTVLAGLDWLARNHVPSSVALLPFSGPPSVSLDEALGEVIDAGVPIVAAAGNSGADACDASPGRVARVLAVGAMGTASVGGSPAQVPLELTNQGPCVDLFAPGDRVTSAWNVDATSTHATSGTSAAAAQAAGAAALFLEAHPGTTAANVVDGIAATAAVGGMQGLDPWTPNRVLDPSAIGPGADVQPPAVWWPAGVDGSIASGDATLRAEARDDVGVTQLAYYVDGVFVAVANASSNPAWSGVWSTALSGNGAHAVVAKAFDAAGHVTESAPATVTVDNVGFATFDPARSVLVCNAPLAECSTGPLVAGRGPVGPERNAPNTILGACADGPAGLLHLDESVDEITIASLDGTPLTVGKGAEVRVKVWSYVDFGRDALDLYSAADATRQSWRLLGTLAPADAGAGTLSLEFTLPQGGLQALRAAFRYGGVAATCTEGLYDDRDDLVFAVAPGTPDTSKPTVVIVEPAPNQVVGAATTLAATAMDGSGLVSRVEFVVDDKVVATAWHHEENAPDRFQVAWDAHEVAVGQHRIYAHAFDGAGNDATSETVSFSVADLTAPSIQLTSPVANAAVTGTIDVEANASDDRGVTAVTFFVAPARAPSYRRAIGTVTTSPWKIAWNTAPFIGDIVLTARAVDGARHTTMSAAVPVYVDHLAPVVSITSPKMLAPPEPDPTIDPPPPPGDPIPPVVSGSVTITLSVHDDHELAKVEYWVGGTLVGTDTNPYSDAPTSFVWSSGAFPNGFYDIVAKAWDTAQNMGVSAPVTVEVRDETPPIVTIDAPGQGASLSLPTTASAGVTDDGIIAKVEFSFDGKVFSTDESPPYAALLDKQIDGVTVPDGTHVLEVAAYDGADHVTTQQVEFRVDNTPPTVHLTSPLAPATITGTYTLRADATDADAIDRVEFWVGPKAIGVAHDAPYEMDWVTTEYDNASFEVGAIAYDLAGNATTSEVVTMTVQNSTTAVYGTTLTAPVCEATGPFCFSATRLQSRSTITPIAEPNQPNTLDACEDGLAGSYGESESIESIKVTTQDGTPLAPGKTVDVAVEYYAFSTDFDRVDLFYAPDANAPAWTRFATLVPSKTGFQTGTGTLVLPSGPLQAVRASMRYAETPGACTPGDFDDHDDLAFAVVTPGVDSTSPAVAISSPVNGGTVHGVIEVKVAATDDAGIARVDLHIDGEPKGTLTVAPYVFVLDTASLTDGSHTLEAYAYDTSGNEKRSNPVVVTVDNAANASYDAALKAPACRRVRAFCDPGALLAGRDQLGPEPNTPNTLQSSCPDGSWGTYQVEGSVESMVVRTPDGSSLGAGRPAEVDVAVIASAAFDADALELYQATDAEAPHWRYLTTLFPHTAGRQVLTTTYNLPAGALQALRARMRYGGVEEACGTYVDARGVEHGVYDDHDDLAFAASGTTVATYDRNLKAPRCSSSAATCDSGSLLDGRASLGPEQNAPNTIHSRCSDGTAGTYHVDRSVDAIRVFTMDAKPLATGKNAVIEVKVFASKTAGDELDVYYALDATAGNPTWTRLATLSPTTDGLETLATMVTLGSGSVQAVRASLHDGATASNPCTTGVKDDHDDLVFAVGAGTPDTTKPDVRIVSPERGAVLGSTTTFAAVATDDSGLVSRVDFLVDGTVVGTASQPSSGTTDRFEVTWSTAGTGDGVHALVARATDGAGNVSDSTAISFWVKDVIPPSVQISIPPPWSAVTGKVPVEAVATDDRGVTGVVFYVNTDLIGTATSSPWRIEWDTGAWNGGVWLVAYAFDAAGNVGASLPIPILVDHVPPNVLITHPADGDYIKGVAGLTVGASDNDFVARIDLLRDGEVIRSCAAATQCGTGIDTTTLTEDAHTLGAVAYDRAGNSTEKSITVRVDNTPPVVRLVTPLGPGTISGSYKLEADASDGQALDAVDFYATPAPFGFPMGARKLIGTVQARPYLLEWDTTTWDNGSYAVEAVAYDRAGNEADTAAVVLDVENTTTAGYESILGVPYCGEYGPFCFSGSLLRGRDTMDGGAEPHEPNTLDGCGDGTQGTYGVDQSIESITVATSDGSSLAFGKEARVDVRYYVQSTETDRVDLYYTTDVLTASHGVSWHWFSTLVPGGTGLQEGSGTFTLQWKDVQAVRAAMRRLPQGVNDCASGPYNDHDDLAFAVAYPGTDSTGPAVAITTPADGSTVHGVVDVSVSASDDRGVARVVLYDGRVPLATLVSSPYVFVWDTAGLDGLRTLTAIAYDGAGNRKASNPVTVSVDNSAASVAP